MDIHKLKPEQIQLIADIMSDPLKRVIVKLLLKERRGLSFFLIYEMIGGSKASLAKALHELTQKGILAYSIGITTPSPSVKASVTNYTINIEHLDELAELLAYY